MTKRFAEHGPLPTPGHCLWCGVKLQKQTWGIFDLKEGAPIPDELDGKPILKVTYDRIEPGGWRYVRVWVGGLGFDGAHQFCTGRCAQAFARALAGRGRLLKSKKLEYAS